MLIRNDLINFEKIIIDVASKSIYISNCDVIISIEVKISQVVIHTLIYIRKTIIVSFRSKIIVFVHHNSILSDQDFFFESNEFNFLLYAHLVNVESCIILIRNDTNKAMQLFRNYRVERITKLNFLNAF